MSLFLKKSNIVTSSSLSISGSKSESNRLLILKALYPNIDIVNISSSDDTNVLIEALNSNSSTFHIHQAGPAMRFLTAFFSTLKSKNVILTGSERMQNRPIEILVNALRSIGADIEYLKEIGYAPIKIKGKELNLSKVSLDSNVSSQYISALFLIGSSLKNGLEINLKGKITSKSYLLMTLSLLNKIDIKYTFNDNVIKIDRFKDSNLKKIMHVESDWSSASYYYSFIALSPINTEITLNSFKIDSLQGDSILSKLFIDFGVETTFNDNSITVKKVNISQSSMNFNLISYPD
jgi:3-phosphoshikimate 1-carboxyvinyltransferase